MTYQQPAGYPTRLGTSVATPFVVPPLCHATKLFADMTSTNQAQSNKASSHSQVLKEDYCGCERRERRTSTEYQASNTS